MVVGAGLIGTAVAWRLAQRGEDVRLVDRPSPQAASGVAAGMLAPVTEATYTDTAIVGLNLASLDRFADLAQELQRTTGLPAGLEQRPTLSVGATADDAAHLRDFGRFLDARGLAVEHLTGRQLRRHEPLLHPGVRSGLLVPGDWAVDNRLLWAALRAAARAAGVRTTEAEVTEVLGSPVTGIRTADGTELAADHVVLAGGATSAGIRLPGDLPELPVRPVKGQVVRLHAGRQPRPADTVRAFASGSEVYLVPRASGELVVGATVEDRGFDTDATAGAVYELLRDARAVLPVTAEYRFTEVSVGWRPATPDHAPLLGPSGVEGLTLATGHHRNGVLLTPVTADVVADWVTRGTLDPIARPFTLDRFRPPARPSSDPSPAAS